MWTSLTLSLSPSVSVYVYISLCMWAMAICVGLRCYVCLLCALYIWHDKNKCRISFFPVVAAAAVFHVSVITAESAEREREKDSATDWMRSIERQERCIFVRLCLYLVHTVGILMLGSIYVCMHASIYFPFCWVHHRWAQAIYTYIHEITRWWTQRKRAWAKQKRSIHSLALREKVSKSLCQMLPMYSIHVLRTHKRRKRESEWYTAREKYRP